MNLLERLRNLRVDHDITQTQLASEFHISQKTYSKYETGQRQIPIELLISLAQYYHVSVDYLLGLTDNPKPYPPHAKK